MIKVYRRIIAVVAAFCMLMSLSTVFAAESNGLEQAILTVKSRIEIPDDFDFDSDINSRGDITVYHFTWRNDDKFISVSVNDKGDIINLHYSGYESEDNSIRFSKYSDDELKKIAFEYIEKINSGWISDLVMDEGVVRSNDIYDSSAYVTFERKVNGIPFLGDSVRVSVSNRTGELLYINANWSYRDEIPDVSNAMSADKAAEEFFKLSPLELVYEQVEGKAVLYYIPKDVWVNINAQKGGRINERYYSTNDTVAEEAAADKVMSSASGGGLSESEIKNINEIANFLPEEKLIKIASSLKNTGLDKAKHKSTRYIRNVYHVYGNEEAEEKKDYSAVLTFVFESGTDGEYTGNVTLNAKTGELISYYAYDYDAYSYGNEPLFKETDAQNKADSFVKEHFPTYFSKTKSEISGGERYDYTVRYVRHENNVPYKSNYLSVGVNSRTGKISSFNKNWDDTIEFESPVGIMSVEEAQKLYEDKFGFELSYMLDFIDSEDGKPELCYTSGTDDGIIGIPAHNTGKDEKNERWSSEDYPTDIASHYAEEQIKALIDAGIITKCELYNPESVITKGELTDLAAGLKGNYGIEIARETKEMLKIVLPTESFDEKEEAQRLDGAVYIIRALGYGEVAEIQGIFNHGFNDEVPLEIAGYVAIAKGLNIVRGDENGAFNATQPLTRADAAIMIYNYLAR